MEQRIVAQHLAVLWRQHGPASWRNTTLDGKAVTISINFNWHNDGLPTKGTLALEFFSEGKVGDTAVALTAEQAARIVQDFASEYVSDVWRLSFLRVLVACFYVPALQAAQVLCPSRFEYLVADFEVQASFCLCIRHPGC